MVAAYKSVIDRGFGESLAEGRRIEVAANREHSRSVTADEIEKRRRAVIDRGRSQGST
jgi:enoyl-CoA hydratase